LALDPLPAGLLGAYRHETGSGWLALVRIAFPNPGASHLSSAVCDEVERGVAEHSRGYKRLHRRARRIGRATAFDLSFRREGPAGEEQVQGRFLLLPNETRVLIGGTNRNAPHALRRNIRHLIISFLP
jgi:hypothetical protein